MNLAEHRTASGGMWKLVGEYLLLFCIVFDIQWFS